MRKTAWIALVGVAALFLLSGYYFGGGSMWGGPQRATGWNGPGMMGGGMMGGGMMGGGMMGGGMMGGYGRAEQVPEVTSNPDAPTAETTLVISEWAISPADLKVEAGNRLVLTVKNNGALPHNLAIPELGVQLVGIASGASRTIELDPPAAGTYDLFCDIPGHAKAGQRGILSVTG